ncbi:16S rRNA (guanine(527)-N(7))-methyltransferase [hydrothermal vent metagenome]|uniref:16S rRNA (Guanine(527)-N(7))-methyltransferase n=1 Tax=hydrothermal vent metagenome TaxID=652676 RepID=A0A3B0V6A4_9ZZZZ
MNNKLINKYFSDLTVEQQKQFEALGDLYTHWNAQINVISRKDIDELYLKHILHSLGIAKVTDFEDGATVLDVGTGGGFPGIPLAILFPKVEFLLIDSIGKKIKVVKEVIKTIGLTNARGQHIRAQETKGTYDYVVSRAVTRITPFYGWVKPKINSGGKILYLKGGDLTEEMAELKKPYREIELSAFFKEDFFETKKVVEVEC